MLKERCLILMDLLASFCTFCFPQRLFPRHDWASEPTLLLILGDLLASFCTFCDCEACPPLLSQAQTHGEPKLPTLPARLGTLLKPAFGRPASWISQFRQSAIRPHSDW